MSNKIDRHREKRRRRVPQDAGNQLLHRVHRLHAVHHGLRHDLRRCGGEGGHHVLLGHRGGHARRSGHATRLLHAACHQGGSATQPASPCLASAFYAVLTPAAVFFGWFPGRHAGRVDYLDRHLRRDPGASSPCSSRWSTDARPRSSTRSSRGTSPAARARDAPTPDASSW